MLREYLRVTVDSQSQGSAYPINDLISQSKINCECEKQTVILIFMNNIVTIPSAIDHTIRFFKIG